MEDMSRAGAVGLPSNAYGERPILPVPVLDDGHLASKKASWAIEYLVGMSMVRSSACMRMCRAIVGMAVGHCV